MFENSPNYNNQSGQYGNPPRIKLINFRTIKWLNENEKAQSAEHIRENRFPNVTAAIDGTHLKLVSLKIMPNHISIEKVIIILIR